MQCALKVHFSLSELNVYMFYIKRKHSTMNTLQHPVLMCSSGNSYLGYFFMNVAHFFGTLLSLSPRNLLLFKLGGSSK